MSFQQKGWIQIEIKISGLETQKWGSTWRQSAKHWTARRRGYAE